MLSSIHVRRGVLLAAVLLFAAACGGDDGGAADQAPPATETPAAEEVEPAGTETTAPPDTGAAAATETPAAAATMTPAAGGDGAAMVAVASTDLGDVLVDAEGMTLYLFTPDEQGASTCYDQCQQNWPPLVAEGDVTVGEELDEALFSTVERDDGTSQVTVNDWPLYYFAGDSAAGDTNGQGVNDVWYAVTPSGEAVSDTTASMSDSGTAVSDY